MRIFYVNVMSGITGGATQYTCGLGRLPRALAKIFEIFSEEGSYQ